MRFNGLLHLIAFPGKVHKEPPASGPIKNKMPDSPAPSQVAARPSLSPYLPLPGYLLPLVLAIFAYLALACNAGDAEPTARPEPLPAARTEVGNPVETVSPGTIEATAIDTPRPTKAPVVATDAAPAPTYAPEPTAIPEPTPTAVGTGVTPTPEATPEPTTTLEPTAPPPAPQEPSSTASCRSISGEAGRPGEVELHVEVIADGLEIPWGLAILPSGDLLVTERPGRLRLVQAGEVVPGPVLEFGVSILPRCSATR